MLLISQNGNRVVDLINPFVNLVVCKSRLPYKKTWSILVSSGPGGAPCFAEYTTLEDAAWAVRNVMRAKSRGEKFYQLRDGATLEGGDHEL